jgi:hypothetical protein
MNSDTVNRNYVFNIMAELYQARSKIHNNDILHSINTTLRELSGNILRDIRYLDNLNNYMHDIIIFPDQYRRLANLNILRDLTDQENENIQEIVRWFLAKLSNYNINRNLDNMDNINHQDSASASASSVSGLINDYSQGYTYFG